MAKVNNRDRELLKRALREGGLKIVAERDKVEPEGAREALQSAWNLCDADCLRLTRIVGQRGAPSGERVYQFIVTPEGAKAGR